MDGNYADLSVLMSVYYKEKPEYLHEAIDSILNQTVKAKEIVLIKDGPLTRELDEVIDEYVSQYGEMFSIFALKENMGLGKALAVGVEKCKFELIARMDTDDICMVDRFEIQLKELHDNQELDIVGSQITEFEEEIFNEMGKRILPLEQDAIYKFAKRRTPFSHVTVIYKKKSILLAGNYIDVKGAEDYYLWARMFALGCKCKNIDKSLVHVRVGDKMLDRRSGYKYLLGAISARRKIHATGINSFFDFIYSSMAIGLMSISPRYVQKIIYSNILRK